MTTLRRRLVGAVAPVVLVSGYSVWAFHAGNPFFPPTDEIASRFRQMWLFDLVASDLLPSLRNFALGYLIAVAAGLVAGIAISRITAFAVLVEPLLDFGRAIPAIMLIPPLVLVLGVGDLAKITIIGFGAFFPVVLATTDGMRRVDPALIDVAQALRISKLRQTFYVRLPAAAPAISGGLQTGLQFALVLMIASEMLAATRGVGYLTMQAQFTFDAPGVWSGIVLLALLGFAFNWLFVLGREHILGWHTAMRATAKRR